MLKEILKYLAPEIARAAVRGLKRLFNKKPKKDETNISPVDNRQGN